MQRRHFLMNAGAAGLAGLGLPQAMAQALPSGPVKLVVGFPPGGGADALFVDE